MLRELNEAMAYIEAHLDEEDLPEKLAGAVGTADCQLRTVFWALTGMTLGEYIRSRRLSEANRALLQGQPVTEVAYRYGYRSVDGFTRAFKRWSGMLPSQAAAQKQAKMSQPLKFVVTIQGGKTMNYRITELPAFSFAGVSRRVPLQFEGVNNAIVELAESITEAQRQEMHRLQDLEPRRVVNVSYASDTGFLEEAGELTHLIGVLTTRADIGCGLERLPMEAHTWAVFPNEGPFPETLQNTMAGIYAEWLPGADYELALSFSFSFTEMDPARPGWAYSEVWVPVVKKTGR